MVRGELMNRLEYRYNAADIHSHILPRLEEQAQWNDGEGKNRSEARLRDLTLDFPHNTLWITRI